MKSDLKRFLVTVAILAVSLVAVDVLFGRLFDPVFRSLPLRDKIPSTIAHRHSDTPDVLLIGSSRCHHHYVSTQLSDSLSAWYGRPLSVYNFGLDAVYVNSSLCAIESLVERSNPQLIVLDANSHEFDRVYTHVVDVASPLYWSDSVVRRYIVQSDRRNRVMMLSSLYRYRNAMPLRMAEVLRMPADTLLGYLPLNSVMDTAAVYQPGPTLDEFDPDGMVADNFRRIADLCRKRGVMLVVADSPRYRPADNSEYVKGLCAECNVPFLDFYSTDWFNSRPELFYEPAHLNAAGAQVFTSMFADSLGTVLRR